MKNYKLNRVLVALIAIFLSVSSFAQVANTNYVEFKPLALAPDSIDYVTLKTGGTTMGYYAKPDAYYHPSYVSPGWALTTGFTWNWSVLPAATIAKPAALNYATVTFTAVDNYVLKVNEQSPAAFGGCAGTDTFINVSVINPPTINVSNANILSNCGDLAIQSIVFNINEAVPVSLASYTFKYNIKVENLDVANDSVLISNTPFTISKLKDLITGFGGASPAYTYTFNSPALKVVNAKRTRYTISLVNDATNGITSGISRKSDFLAGVTTFHPAGNTKPKVIFIVNPQPKTGPIYHIPNAFDL